MPQSDEESDEEERSIESDFSSRDFTELVERHIKEDGRTRGSK